MSSIFDRKTIFTVFFVASLLLLVVLRTNSWRWAMPSWIGQSFAAPTSAAPEDAIYGMLDAARAGDAKAYLDTFAPPMRDQLQQVIKENSEANFIAYLKSQNVAFQ